MWLSAVRSNRMLSAAVVLWTIVLVVVGVRSIVQPRHRTTYTIWSSVGSDWFAGRDLYEVDGAPDGGPARGFRYSPAVAAMLVPWGFLPDGVGGALWRVVGAVALLAAFVGWLRCFDSNLNRTHVAACLLLLLPLCLSTLGNAQMNMLVAALLLATVVAAARERWTAAAWAVGLATALKVYPLALGLVLAAAFPKKFAFRLFGVLAALAVLPFALQSPEYVLRQYSDWWQLLRTADEGRRYFADAFAYRDLWLLLRVWGASPSLPTYYGMQAAAGAACAAWCVVGRLRGRTTETVLRDAFVLTTCWMMVCGPSTESSTYALFAPIMAWWLVRTHEHESPVTRDLTIIGAAFLGLCVVGGAMPGGAGRFHGAALHPLGVLFFGGSYLIAEVQRARQRGAATVVLPNVRTTASCDSAKKAA